MPTIIAKTNVSKGKAGFMRILDTCLNICDDQPTMTTMSVIADDRHSGRGRLVVANI